MAYHGQKNQHDVPIFDGSEPVGVVSEEGLVKKLATTNASQWKKTQLKELMTWLN